MSGKSKQSASIINLALSVVFSLFCYIFLFYKYLKNEIWKNWHYLLLSFSLYSEEVNSLTMFEWRSTCRRQKGRGEVRQDDKRDSLRIMVVFMHFWEPKLIWQMIVVHGNIINTKCKLEIFYVGVYYVILDSIITFTV